MRTALITGASRGMGKEIADLLTKQGVRVISPSRSELDLSNQDSVLRFCNNFDWKIDYLINNAGINPIREISEIDFAVINEVYMVNTFAPMMLIKHAAIHMSKNNYGRIVNISSIWSGVSKPGRMLYAGSKSAINSLTRTAALELGEYDILVNAIAPGFVDTELTRQNNTPEALQKIIQDIPLLKMAEVKNIADLVWFLCSDANQYITGQTIFIDGGYTCK